MNTVLGVLPHHSRETATDFLTKLIEGHFIRSYDNDEGIFKLKSLLGLTRKGACIADDVRAGMTDEQSDGDVIYLEWKGGVVVRPSMETIFKRFAGTQPNEWTPEKEKALAREMNSDPATPDAPSTPVVSSPTDSTGSLSSNSGSDAPPGILVKDRMSMLKTYTKTFQGNEAVIHLLDHTSALTRREAVHILDEFSASGWIQQIEKDDKEQNRFKDSKSVMYQLTATGAKLAGWDEFDVPTVREFFSRPSFRGLRKMSVFGLGGEDGNGPISRENLEKFDEFVKKSSEALNADDDGPRDKSGKPHRRTTFAAGIFTDKQGAGASGGTWGKGKGKKARPRSATSVATENGRLALSPLSTTSSSTRLSTTQSASTTATGPQPWESAKDTNTSRLTTILNIPPIRTAFHTFLASLFCQENFDFMVDVERFRLCYDTFHAAASIDNLDKHSKQIVTQVHETQAHEKSTADTEIHPHSTLIPHAMILYLKYIPKTAPHELNIPSNLQKHLTTLASALEEFFPHFLDHNEVLLEPSPPINPTSPEFINVVQTLPPEFWKKTQTVEGFEPWMFSSAEAHIFQVVAGDSVPKFVKTDTYRGLMSEAWEKGLLPAPGAMTDRRLSNAEDRRASVAGNRRQSHQEGAVERRASDHGTIGAADALADVKGKAMGPDRIPSQSENAGARRNYDLASTQADKQGDQNLVPRGEAGLDNEEDKVRDQKPVSAATSVIKTIPPEFAYGF